MKTLFPASGLHSSSMPLSLSLSLSPSPFLLFLFLAPPYNPPPPFSPPVALAHWSRWIASSTAGMLAPGKRAHTRAREREKRSEQRESAKDRKRAREETKNKKKEKKRGWGACNLVDLVALLVEVEGGHAGHAALGRHVVVFVHVHLATEGGRERREGGREAEREARAHRV
eukprot:1443567-Rhodomonas_salina.1